MGTPKPTELEIRQVGELKTTSKGNVYIEYTTNLGLVAFWGDTKDMRNITTVQDGQPPFKAICGCIPANWGQHALWVPQGATVTVLTAGH